MCLVDGTLVGEGSRVPGWRTVASPDWPSSRRRISSRWPRWRPKPRAKGNLASSSLKDPLRFLSWQLIWQELNTCPDTGRTCWVGLEILSGGDEHRLARGIGKCFTESPWHVEVGEEMRRGPHPACCEEQAGGEPVVLWRGISQNKDVSRGEPKVALPDMCSVF